MGNPRNYSVELPRRAHQLIESLWSTAQRTREPARPDLGPLTTTFLLSMSMPIIAIPIERMARAVNAAANYADDTKIDAAFTKVFRDLVASSKLRDAPFYQDGAWRFVQTAEQFNSADGLPWPISDELKRPEAIRSAGNLSVTQWSRALRNALAHGGVTFLDKTGSSSYGTPVALYAFVSEWRDAKTKSVKGRNVLRISEADYRSFLTLWVEWLNSTKLKRLIA